MKHARGAGRHTPAAPHPHTPTHCKTYTLKHQAPQTRTPKPLKHTRASQTNPKQAQRQRDDLQAQVDAKARAAEAAKAGFAKVEAAMAEVHGAVAGWRVDAASAGADVGVAGA